MMVSLRFSHRNRHLCKSPRSRESECRGWFAMTEGVYTPGSRREIFRRQWQNSYLRADVFALSVSPSASVCRCAQTKCLHPRIWLSAPRLAKVTFIKTIKKAEASVFPRDYLPSALSCHILPNPPDTSPLPPSFIDDYLSALREGEDLSRKQIGRNGRDLWCRVNLVFPHPMTSACWEMDVCSSTSLFFRFGVLSPKYIKIYSFLFKLVLMWIMAICHTSTYVWLDFLELYPAIILCLKLSSAAMIYMINGILEKKTERKGKWNDYTRLSRVRERHCECII